jgi:phage head maturation protease
MTLQLYLPIAKLDRDQREVYGYASTEATDSQGEIVTKEALEAALPAYMRFANIREMHLPSAVGIAQEAVVDDKGLWLRACIVDDEAWRKVREGVYKGFSIGGAVTARAAEAPHIVTGLDLTEISLVDRPANPDAVFAVWKRADPRAKASFTPASDATSGLTDYDLEGASDDKDGADFADPGYQADRKKRYPLDSEARIRAAWNYIHHPANQKSYSAAQFAQIRTRIVAAWKAKIDRAGPPASRGAGKLAKLGDDRVRLAALADELDWFGGTLAPDGPDDELAPAIARVCAALHAMLAADDGDEADDGDDIARAVMSQRPRSVPEGAVLAKLGARTSALEGELGRAMPLLLQLKELVEKVASQPAVVPPSRLVAIDKSADVARELERIAEQPPAMTAFELIRRALREPLPFGAQTAKD